MKEAQTTFQVSEVNGMLEWHHMPQALLYVHIYMHSVALYKRFALCVGFLKKQQMTLKFSAMHFKYSNLASVVCDKEIISIHRVHRTMMLCTGRYMYM